MIEGAIYCLFISCWFYHQASVEGEDHRYVSCMILTIVGTFFMGRTISLVWICFNSKFFLFL